jgi:hypothetical protein
MQNLDNTPLTITIQVTTTGIRIENSGLPQDLLLAVLHQAVAAVSAQIIQSWMSPVIPVKAVPVPKDE